MQDKKDLVFCADCKWSQLSELNPKPEFARCYVTTEYDLVTGGTKAQYCAVARQLESMCGKTGKWYEPNIDEVNQPNVEEMENVQ